MIKIFMLILRGIKLSSIMTRFLGKILYAIWGFIRKVASNPATFWIVGLYPIIEIIIMSLTGWQGVLSPSINSAIEYMFNLVVEKVVPDFNLNDSYSSLPEKALQISAYIGLTSAIQSFINGMIQIAILFINVKIALYVVKIKFALMQKVFKSRGGYL